MKYINIINIILYNNTHTGRRWRCNICGMLNDVPTPYFSHLDGNGQRRSEL